MTDYNYEVFISYRRNNLIEPWVTNFFLKFFRNWLNEKLIEKGYSNEIGFEARVFFDQIDNEPGMLWPDNLQTAIRTSKVLVSICSPTYFTSSWCRSEWETFGQRENLIGRAGLRIPVRHNDCEPFLQGIQWSDFYGYTYLAKEFYQTAQATIFEQKIEHLAAVVANAIITAPPFDNNWPTINLPTISPNIKMQRL
jgi:hypothetical protein